MKITKHDCQLLIRPFGGTDSPYHHVADKGEAVRYII